MLGWLAFSLIFLCAWLVLFALRPSVRKEMSWVSLFTMPFGLLEPLFVPAYWNPPSLFNLAATTHFDIESLIFCFAVGGLASVTYEAVFHATHEKLAATKLKRETTLLHRLSLALPVLVFILIEVPTKMNPIYPAILAMFIGGIATLACRHDLAAKVLVGGLMFAGLYFIFFASLSLIVPQFTLAWNTKELTGITVANVPIEEILFAFTFGMLWSSAYEHIKGYRLTKPTPLQD